MTPQNENLDTHAWFTDQIATYLADGLDTEEKREFDSHVAECESCANALNSERGDDSDLRNLFAGIHPSAGFEDRIIQKLRQAPSPSKFVLPAMPRMAIHPMVKRAAAVTAAAMILAGFGYIGNRLINRDGAPLRYAKAESDLRQIEQQIPTYYQYPTPPVEQSVASPAPMRFGDSNNHAKDGQNVLYGDGHVNFSGVTRGLSYSYANPYPDPSAISGGYRLIKGLGPTFVVSADVNPGNTPTAGPRDTSYFKPAEAAAPSQVADEARKMKTGLVASNMQTSTSPVQQAQSPADLPPAGTRAAPTAPDTPRKIIRHGELSFEVDSFDSAFVQISKIAAEEGGFIDATSSDKLDNGKVSGVVTVRLPPEHLDTLVLKLRGIGDLKGQKIASDDVTRQYTDLQSELRAASAMEDHLLDIIKTGKGDVKELVLAEREVGVWREKVENITGQINYYNNLISLSTLQINVTERDIRQAATASETETVDMGVETPDVEKARADALRAVDDAKGRIIQSDLKKYEAGQMAATIVAQVSPLSVGPVIDRFKQLGRVARMDVNRHQSTADGAPVAPGIKVHREDTQIQVSLYNLANVAPRQTTNVALACDDVESAYRAMLSRIEGAGGRVVDSSLNRSAPDQVNGTINFDAPTDKCDGLLNDLRGLGQVLTLSVAENPDIANVTDAKRGFALTLMTLANIPPRQSTVMNIDVSDPEKISADLQASALAADGRIVDESLSKTDRMVAHLVIDVPLKAGSDLTDRARSSGTLKSIQQNKNPSAPDADSARARLDLTLSGASELVAQDTGVFSSFKSGLGTSIRGLAYSLELVVIGVCLILPWAAAIWVGWKLFARHGRQKGVTGAV